MTMPVDELRAAVRNLRRPGIRGAYTASSSAAAILRARGPLSEWLEGQITLHYCDPRDGCVECVATPDALAIARAINGTADHAANDTRGGEQR
ncbi:hypothetical protein [Streptomyces fagopyri]|uniref:hypothetical protein n=1 Tax=Streptomyces fagopyri TaxID=2662397 RepID=UPI00381AA166